MLDWANLMINFPFKDYIIFSDEFFWLFDNVSKGWFHLACAHLLSIDNNSGISCDGKFFMHTLRENLNSHRFLQILLNKIIHSANQLYPHE